MGWNVLLWGPVNVLQKETVVVKGMKNVTMHCPGRFVFGLSAP